MNFRPSYTIMLFMVPVGLMITVWPKVEGFLSSIPFAPLHFVFMLIELGICHLNWSMENAQLLNGLTVQRTSNTSMNWIHYVISIPQVLWIVHLAALGAFVLFEYLDWFYPQYHLECVQITECYDVCCANVHRIVQYWTDDRSMLLTALNHK